MWVEAPEEGMDLTRGFSPGESFVTGYELMQVNAYGQEGMDWDTRFWVVPLRIVRPGLDLVFD
jgi:hypothetical protein